jgi:hypothetical protein
MAELDIDNESPRDKEQFSVFNHREWKRIVASNGCRKIQWILGKTPILEVLGVDE